MIKQISTELYETTYLSMSVLAREQVRRVVKEVEKLEKENEKLKNGTGRNSKA